MTLINVTSNSAIVALVVLGAILGLLCLIRKRIDISGVLPFMGIVSILGAQALFTIFVNRWLGATTFALTIITLVVKCSPRKKPFAVFAILLATAVILEALEVAGYPLVF